MVRTVWKPFGRSPRARRWLHRERGRFTLTGDFFEFVGQAVQLQGAGPGWTIVAEACVPHRTRLLRYMRPGEHRWLKAATHVTFWAYPPG